MIFFLSDAYYTEVKALMDRLPKSRGVNFINWYIISIFPKIFESSLRSPLDRQRKWMQIKIKLILQVTTLTLMLTVKPSTSAPLTNKAAFPRTPSSAPTEPSSTQITSSVTGGSILIALRLWLSLGMLIILPKQESLLSQVILKLQPHGMRTPLAWSRSFL